MLQSLFLNVAKALFVSCLTESNWKVFMQTFKTCCTEGLLQYNVGNPSVCAAHAQN